MMDSNMNRSELLFVSEKKTVPPFEVDPTLTFYCPQENVEAFDHPFISRFHRFMLKEYVPPIFQGKAVLLLLPCVKTKPYSFSKEHLEINTYLLNEGYRPTKKQEYPDGLLAHLTGKYEQAAVNTSPLIKEGVTLHRMVVSEPMGLVPYEHLYFWNNKLSPLSSYDDPGLFEHRGTAVGPWRDDYSGIKGKKGYRWGDNEKAAYVKAHNYLVGLIVSSLSRLDSYYQGILAYVSPLMTHRSFLSSKSEKRLYGLPMSRRTSKGLLELKGVNDRKEGWIRCIPDKIEIEHILGKLEKKMPDRSSRQVKGYFAGGGIGVTPLVLPETLTVLKRNIDEISGS